MARLPWFLPCLFSSEGLWVEKGFEVVHSASQTNVFRSGWASSRPYCTASISILLRNPALKRDPDLRNTSDTLRLLHESKKIAQQIPCPNQSAITLQWNAASGWLRSQLGNSELVCNDSSICLALKKSRSQEWSFYFCPTMLRKSFRPHKKSTVTCEPFFMLLWHC